MHKLLVYFYFLLQGLEGTPGIDSKVLLVCC